MADKKPTLNVAGLPLDRQQDILAKFKEVDTQLQQAQGQCRLWRGKARAAEKLYREAQEERDKAQGTFRFQQYLRMRLELDKAIERGRKTWHWGRLGWDAARKWLVWHDDEYNLRKAAERDAAEQRALAEELAIAADALQAKVPRTIADAELVRVIHAIRAVRLAPAEAQEEGDPRD